MTNRLIIPTIVVDGDPVCSRCGMAYGVWELTLKWDADPDATTQRPFEHHPGCRWTVPGHHKDFGDQLRAGELIPRNANILRTQ